MHTIGSSGNCDIDPVVYYAQYAGIFTNSDEFESKGKKFIIVNIRRKASGGLCAQLNAIGTACYALMS
jgi:hypothetical protein